MGFWKEYGRTIVALGSWYLCNLSTLMLNKYLYVYYAFRYPFSLTSIHMLLCTVGTHLIVNVFHWHKRQNIEGDGLRSILLLGGLFSFNIVLGNVSLVYVPVSFMQTIKSSVPAFTVFLQSTVLRQPISKEVGLSIIPVVGGVAMATLTEVNFDIIGFSTAMIASFTTAVQTVVSGVLLRGKTKLTSINLLRLMSPIALLLIAPLAIIWEIPKMKEEWKYFGTYQSIVVLFLSGLIALLLNITTFIAINVASPLTFNVAGNVKVILSIAISVAIFRNKIVLLNGVGIVIAVAGVIAYSNARRREREENTKTEPASSLSIKRDV